MKLLELTAGLTEKTDDMRRGVDIGSDNLTKPGSKIYSRFTSGHWIIATVHFQNTLA